MSYADAHNFAAPPTSHNTELSTPESRPADNVVLARPTHSTRHAMSALRSQFDSKGKVDEDFTVHHNDVELDIRVCVERSVVIDYANDFEQSRKKPTVK